MGGNQSAGCDSPRRLIERRDRPCSPIVLDLELGFWKMGRLTNCPNGPCLRAFPYDISLAPIIEPRCCVSPRVKLWL
jgi:hypothetical protein